jgi:flagellar FliL protein
MSGRNASLQEDKGPGHIVENDMEAPSSLRKKQRGKLVIIAIALLLLLLGAGGYLAYTGIIKLPFLPHETAQTKTDAQQVQFIKIPELVANLDAGPDSDSYAKMETELEVADPASAAAVNAQMPAIIDLFQTYLRSMQPNDLRGSEGLYRLREALLARANIIVAPATVQNVLFIEMVVQ